MTQQSAGFTHLDESGRARMVDVTAKSPTVRVASAVCSVRSTREAVQALSIQEPDPLVVAQIAGLQAAKVTAQLIPLCHPLHPYDVEVRLCPHDAKVEITSVVRVVDRTGVEIEALTACAMAGLSLIHALADTDPLATVEHVTLVHKSGGRSGTWERDPRLAGDRAARPD